MSPEKNAEVKALQAEAVRLARLAAEAKKKLAQAKTPGSEGAP